MIRRRKFFRAKSKSIIDKNWFKKKMELKMFQLNIEEQELQIIFLKKIHYLVHSWRVEVEKRPRAWTHKSDWFK